jgi:putative MATE family efflux protein
VKIIVSTRDILKLAAPISLALLIPQVNFLTNTAFIGRLGALELGVNGIAGVYYLILAMVGYGLSNGMQVLMARRVGEGNRPGLGKLFSNGIVLSFLLSVTLITLSLWLAPLVFSFSLHQDEHVLMAVDFLYVRVWGLPFLMLTQLANAFFIATGKSKYLIAGSFTGTLVNIVLDYLLIFGNGGFEAMGLHGAALASVLAEVAACLVMWGTFYGVKMHRFYPIRQLLRIDWAMLRNVLSVSSPLIIQYFFSIGGWLVFFIFVEHLGTQELAASQMLRSVLGIVGVITWAFASSCNTLVSRTIGQGLQRQVPRLIGKILVLSVLCTSVICLVLVSFPAYFLSLYTNDAALIAFSIPALRVVALATVLMSLGTVVFNGVVGTGNTNVNLTIEVICVGAYLLYCSIFIQQLRLPLSVAWGSEFMYWGCLLLISGLYLRSGRWKGKVI